MPLDDCSKSINTEKRGCHILEETHVVANNRKDIKGPCIVFINSRSSASCFSASEQRVDECIILATRTMHSIKESKMVMKTVKWRYNRHSKQKNNGSRPGVS